MPSTGAASAACESFKPRTAGNKIAPLRWQRGHVVVSFDVEDPPTAADWQEFKKTCSELGLSMARELLKPRRTPSNSNNVCVDEMNNNPSETQKGVQLMQHGTNGMYKVLIESFSLSKLVMMKERGEVVTGLKTQRLIFEPGARANECTTSSCPFRFLAWQSCTCRIEHMASGPYLSVQVENGHVSVGAALQCVPMRFPIAYGSRCSRRFHMQVLGYGQVIVST